MYRLGNAAVRPFPFPHFFVEDVFPAELYARLRRHLPATDVYQPISEGGQVARDDGSAQGIYKERYVLHFRPEQFARMTDEDRAVWGDFSKWLLGQDFLSLVLSKFEDLLYQRFGDALKSLEFHSSAQLLRDFTNYSLGPHSDHPLKVLVLIFYLPETDATEHLGTSLYLAHDPAAHDDTGKHFAREDFALAATMPFKPNCAMGFFKTPTSFHGVERVAGPTDRRDLIQFAVTYRDPAR